MNKIAALIAAGVIAMLPIVANAGAAPCPDYTGDGYVGIADVLFAVDHYMEDQGDGTLYSISDILLAVEHYGETCA